MPSRSPVPPNGPRISVVLAALAALALLTGSLPATAVAVHPDGGSTGASSPDTTGDRATCPRTPGPADATVSSANASPPTPNESADLTVARGDVAVVPLSVPAGANVSVAVGADDGDVARLAVRDDGDGQVRLLVNTYLAGNRTAVAPGAYRTAGDDPVTVVGGTPNASLDAGSYPVTARHDGSVVDERELAVTDPSFESVTARRAVPRLFEATNASEVRAANRSGLTDALRPGEHGPEVVSGETLLLRVEAPSLLGAVVAQPGNTTTERFLALTRDVAPDTPESFEISGPCGGIRFADTADAGGARTLLDFQEGAVYVLLDTTELVGIPDGGQMVYVEASPESRLNEADEEVELKTRFRIGSRQTTMRPNGTEVVPLSADERATVSGETNLLPGSRVAVRVASRVTPTFERATTATVAGNGTFAASLDLSNASTPAPFAVRVGPARFPAATGNVPTVHWELDYYGGNGVVEEFALERLALPDDGLLVAYRYDNGADRFHPVGSATRFDDELSVEPLSESQQLLLVVHRDANGNLAFDGPTADPPYRVDGKVVREWTSVTVDGVAPAASDPPATFDADRVTAPSTETPTTSRSTTATTADPATRTSAESETSETSAGNPLRDEAATTSASEARTPGDSDSPDVSLPGFGALAVLFALLGVTTLLRVRRR